MRQNGKLTLKLQDEDQYTKPLPRQIVSNCLIFLTVKLRHQKLMAC